MTLILLYLEGRAAYRHWRLGRQGRYREASELFRRSMNGWLWRVTLIAPAAFLDTVLASVAWAWLMS